MEEHGKIPIENCTRLFKFLCPKKWENLQPTEEEDVRFCNSCRKNVTLCTTTEEVRAHSGHCIALIGYEDLAEERLRMAMGRTLPFRDYSPLQRANDYVSAYEESVTKMTVDQKED